MIPVRLDTSGIRSHRVPRPSQKEVDEALKKAKTIKEKQDQKLYL